MTTIFKHSIPAILPLLGCCILATISPVQAQFVPDDIQVGAAGVTYGDPEFHSPANRMVFQNNAGGVQRLWIAELNPADGRMLSSDGKDLLVDENVATLGPTNQTNNGPEWGEDSGGFSIWYSKPDPSGVVQVYRATNLSTGNVTATKITNVPAGANACQAVAQKDPLRSTTQFFYRYAPGPEQAGPARWADETAGTELNQIPNFSAAGFAPSWISGTGDFAYTKAVAADRSEIMRYDNATRTATQVTNEPGTKKSVLAIKAPELGGELVYACVLSDSTLTIFRDLGAGYVRWLDLTPPDPQRTFMLSPEPFEVNGVTYFAVQMLNGPSATATDAAMWILGLGADPANRLARRVDEGATSGTAVVRREPEPYVGSSEAFLYYNASGQLRRARTGITTQPLSVADVPGTELAVSRGLAYSLALPASGGVAPYAWQITGGALPAGLVLSNDGVVAGAPTVNGTFSYTVRVTDAAGATVDKTFSVKVAEGFAPSAPFIGQQGGSYADPEFSEGASQVTFMDSDRTLWVGDLNPQTATFVTATGRDYQMDTGISYIVGTPGLNAKYATNGPEWVRDGTGWAVAYTKEDPQGIQQQWKAKIVNGQSVITQLTTDAQDCYGNAPSRFDDGLPPRIAFNYIWPITSAKLGWIFVNDPTNIHVIEGFDPFQMSMWSSVSSDFGYVHLPPGSTTGQIGRLNADTNVGQVLTNDAGSKNDPGFFLAPEFGGELCMVARVDNTSLGVYRNLNAPDGFWTRIATLRLPAGTTHKYIFSTEILAPQTGIGGVTYFAVNAADVNDWRGGDRSIWVLGLGTDPANRFVRRIDDGALTGAAGNRLEPEPYTATEQAYVFYNNNGLRRAATGIFKSALSIADPAATMPSASVGSAFSFQFSATGGSGPYAWSLASGTLPPGITLSGTGLLSGTPSGHGTFTFTVQATDQLNATHTRQVSLSVVGAPRPGGPVPLQYPELALSVICTDATRAREFYIESLGMVDEGEAANQPPGLRMYLYGVGQANLKVRIYDTDPPGRDAALLATNGMRFITIPVSDFDGAITRMAARGFAAPTVQTSGGVRTGMATDGDGNVVELIDTATAPTRKLEIGIIADSASVAAAQTFYATTMGLPVAAAVAGPSPVPGTTEYRYAANSTVLRFFAPTGTRTTPNDTVGGMLGFHYITFTLTSGLGALHNEMVAQGIPIASPLAPFGTDAMLFMVYGPGGAIHEFVGPLEPSPCVVSKTSVTVPEGGTATFTVQLSAPPSANVSVGLARSNGDANLTISPSSLVFTPTDWNTPRTVTLSAATDADVINGTANFALNVSGAAKLYVSAEEAEPASGDWIDMKFTADYYAPAVIQNDPLGMEGRTLEVMALENHGGKLYACASYVETQNPSSADPKILVKDGASSPWRIEYRAGNWTARLSSLRSVSFTRDHNGAVLNPPVPFLLCGTGAWEAWNPDGVYMLSRGPSGAWERSKLSSQTKNPGDTNHDQEVRSLFDYFDPVANRHLVFAASSIGSVFSGVFNSSTGKIDWNPVAEIYGSNGRGLGFAVANGVLHMALAYQDVFGAVQPTKNYGLWRRIDGVRNAVDAAQTAPATVNPQWEWVDVPQWENPSVPGESLRKGQIRGLMALPDPLGGGHQVLGLHWDVPDGKLERVDPMAGYQATVELDTKGYFSAQWGGGYAATLGYNDWCPAVHPTTGQAAHLIGAWTNYPPGETLSDLSKSSWLMLRTQNPVSHKLVRIWDPANALVGADYGLRGCRSIRPSPFPEEQGRVWYLCGFDSTNSTGAEIDGSHGWIYKGTLGTVSPLGTPFATVQSTLRDATALTLAQPVMGNVGAAVYGAVDATSSQGGTLSIQTTPAWQHRHNGAANLADAGLSLSLGAAGEVFVGGRATQSGAATDAAALRYSTTSGTPLWTRTANGPAGSLDEILATVATPDGGVAGIGRGFGIGTGSDVAIWKWAADGTLAWTYRYTGSGSGTDFGRALAVRPDGSIAFAGYSPGTGTGANDWVVGAVSATGTELWVNRYNGPGNSDDQASGICVDTAGNVFATGFQFTTATNRDLLLIKYNADGTSGWQATYDFNGQGDWGVACAWEPSGDIFVGGYSVQTNTDFVTLRYTATGTRRWATRYNGPGNGNEQVRALALLPDGGVAVAGNSPGSGTGDDWVIVRYSSGGTQQWVARLAGSNTTGNDIPYSLTADQAGNLYAAGSLANTGAGNDYAVARFNAADGTLAWKWTYNGPSGTDDVAQSLRVNKAGEVFATGWSTSSTGTDIYTAKLTQTLRYTPPVGGFTGSDTFNVTLVDDQGRVVNALVQTTVWPPPGAAMGASLTPGGPLSLTLNGGTGLTYVLEYSDDLSQWFPLGTYTLAAPAETFDVPITGVPRRFYRFRFVP